MCTPEFWSPRGIRSSRRDACCRRYTCYVCSARFAKAKAWRLFGLVQDADGDEEVDPEVPRGLCTCLSRGRCGKRLVSVGFTSRAVLVLLHCTRPRDCIVHQSHLSLIVDLYNAASRGAATCICSQTQEAHVRGSVIGCFHFLRSASRPRSEFACVQVRAVDVAIAELRVEIEHLTTLRAPRKVALDAQLEQARTQRERVDENKKRVR